MALEGTIIKTICQMCYYYCGLNVTVKNNQIIRVEGMKESPVNQGRLCVKGLACPEIVSDPKRLKSPLKRVGERGSGKWKMVTWDQALDEISEKMLKIRDAFGPEYIGYYRGHAPGWVTNFNYVCRFMNSWDSPNLFTHAHLCFGPRAIAHMATFGRFPEPDFENTNCILLIGSNPVYTSPVNYAPRIIWAKQRGAKLIVVDPRFTHTSAKAELCLQNRLGTTGALILGMINVIIEDKLYDERFIKDWVKGFEQLRIFIKDYTPEKVEEITWVHASKIRKAAEMVATIKPAVVLDGNGLDQETNTVQTVRATSILRCLIRSVQEPGGSIMMPLLPFVDVQRRSSQPPDFYAKSVCQYPAFAAGGAGLTGVEMIDSITTQNPYGIKAIIVQGGDPVAVLSNTDRVREALKKLDLLVVHDLYHSATGQIADFVLPAASFLERDLVLYYRYRPKANINLIAMQNKCVPPVGQSKSDLALIFALARKLGLQELFPWENECDAFNWELEANGISVEWLRKHPGGFVREYTPDEIYQSYKKNMFQTPSGKIEFVSSQFEKMGYDPLPTYQEPAMSPISRPDIARDFPLIGSTGLKLGIHTHTQFRTLPRIKNIESDPFAEIHPQTASELKLKNREWIQIETPEGSTTARTRISLSVLPGTVFLTFGYGQPYAGKENLVNRLTSDRKRDPIAGVTSNRSFLCRVKKSEVCQNDKL